MPECLLRKMRSRIRVSWQNASATSLRDLSRPTRQEFLVVARDGLPHGRRVSAISRVFLADGRPGRGKRALLKLQQVGEAFDGLSQTRDVCSKLLCRRLQEMSKMTWLAKLPWSDERNSLLTFKASFGGVGRNTIPFRSTGLCGLVLLEA